MVEAYLQEQGIKAILLPALDFMRTDKNSEPNLHEITDLLSKIMEENTGYQIYLHKDLFAEMLMVRLIIFNVEDRITQHL